MARWVEAEGVERGRVIRLDQVNRLAKVWYVDPRAPSWRPRTRDESQAVLASVGLTGEFWELPK